MELFSRKPTFFNDVDRQHDREVLCIDVSSDIVTGSADHGLRVFSSNGSFKRELFGKEAGHTELVTSCSWTPDGRIVSGGMDARVCLWPRAGGKTCNFLMGHSASISKLAVDSSNHCVTVGYDGLTLLWNLNGGTSPIAAYGGITKQPVLDFGWLGRLLVTSNRGGDLCFFDVNTEKRVGVVRGANNGATCKIGFCSNSLLSASSDNNLLMTAGRSDARISLYDIRTSTAKPIAQSIPLHKSSLNGCDWNASKGLIYSASWDGTLRIYDLRGDISFKRGIEIGVGAPVECTDVVQSPQGTSSCILVGTHGGGIVSVDWDGFEKWRHDVSAPVTAIKGSAHGVIGVGLQDGRVIAIS
eukprot:GDKJ01016418.1.p1 GENE.GDKJ01016418.1~~GDKJ01016418.1.p1  ORF type:complete len:356 (-),score=44.08 GDKJ01016418.1:496-1563(-)